MSPRNLIHWMTNLKRHGTLKLAAAPVIDALEGRLLLTSCPSLTLGVMTVNADTAADTLVIRTVSGEIRVLDGGNQVCAFTENQVNAVVVNASDGNDSLTIESSVGALPFQINGGSGNDTLLGHTQADTINGDAGNDSIDGGAGTDSILGGDDNDVLHGGDGNDSLFGEAGNETMVGGLGSDDFNGGNGSDTVDYSQQTSANLSVSIDNQANDGASGEGDDVGDTVETLIGSSGNDTLTGSDVHNRIEGRGGNDVLNGDLNSTVSAGQGSDTLDGGDGDDTLDGVDGGDTLYDSPGLDVIYGGLGTDVFHAYDEVPDPEEADLCDTLDGGDGTDFIGDTYGENIVSIP